MKPLTLQAVLSNHKHKYNLNRNKRGLINYVSMYAFNSTNAYIYSTNAYEKAKNNFIKK